LQPDLFLYVALVYECLRPEDVVFSRMFQQFLDVFLMWLNGESMSVPLFLLHGINSWTWESFERVLCHRWRILRRCPRILVSDSRKHVISREFRT